MAWHLVCCHHSDSRRTLKQEESRIKAGRVENRGRGAVFPNSYRSACWGHGDGRPSKAKPLRSSDFFSPSPCLVQRIACRLRSRLLGYRNSPAQSLWATPSSVGSPISQWLGQCGPGRPRGVGYIPLPRVIAQAIGRNFDSGRTTGRPEN